MIPEPLTTKVSGNQCHEDMTRLKGGGECNDRIEQGDTIFIIPTIWHQTSGDRVT